MQPPRVTAANVAMSPSGIGRKSSAGAGALVIDRTAYTFTQRSQERDTSPRPSPGAAHAARKSIEFLRQLWRNAAADHVLGLIQREDHAERRAAGTTRSAAGCWGLQFNTTHALADRDQIGLDSKVWTVPLETTSSTRGRLRPNSH
jgi:hypothetical protein